MSDDIEHDPERVTADIDRPRDGDLTIAVTSFDPETNSVTYKATQTFRVPRMSPEAYADLVASSRAFTEAARRAADAAGRVAETIAESFRSLEIPAPPSLHPRVYAHATRAHRGPWLDSLCAERDKPGTHTITEEWAATEEYKVSHLCIRCLFGPHIPDALADEADPDPMPLDADCGPIHVDPPEEAARKIEGEVRTWLHYRLNSPPPTSHIGDAP